MMDALITGAGGFIGQSLRARLRADGQNVLALTSANGDVGSADTWKTLPRARVLYHLAGRSFVPDSWAQGPDFVATNVVGTERALAYCREHGARLVLASAYVYGIPERLPIGESDTVAPNNPYALSKYLAEQLCEFAAQYQGVTATALRIFNVFGPGQREEFLVPKILQQVKDKEAREIRLFDLAPRRDYVFLSDVVDAFAKAADLDTGFHAINVGSGMSLSVAEIVDKIQVIAGSRLPVVSDYVERNQEIPDVVADIARAQQIMGWRPQWSFERGIEQILKRV
ncbi:NAD(P)-dependent oxidoreductase [Laribacter hongkongensis]|uniref:NAD-dependent epimerase/dehydratase family protein n=1 Tax=Laribacter hongkongensis TaxID=168471 RepID=UPI001EFE035A|nr:NAD(P)-dependent oxidoreductase [Laribacter hongkongensis]MCG9022861.1 NAD(P)-dependent oxidoreductase [Laribacter hongkongensis]